jgi:hypothetical protein
MTAMANEQQTYLQEIARLRQQRAQAELQDRVRQIQEDYVQNMQGRDEAARNNDPESWHYWDSLVEQNERDYQAFVPVQRPQDPPAWTQWALRNRAFYDRYGDRAKQAVQAAHGYITRPKNPRETHPDRRGMGIQAWTPAYFSALEGLLQTHGRLVGLNYDPSEKALTPDEAAEASGLSARDYNRAVVDLRNQGRLNQDD